MEKFILYIMVIILYGLVCFKKEILQISDDLMILMLLLKKEWRILISIS